MKILRVFKCQLRTTWDGSFTISSFLLSLQEEESLNDVIRETNSPESLALGNFGIWTHLA